jgi:hypothetical protein
MPHGARQGRFPATTLLSVRTPPVATMPAGRCEPARSGAPLTALGRERRNAPVSPRPEPPDTGACDSGGSQRPPYPSPVIGDHACSTCSGWDLGALRLRAAALRAATGGRANQSNEKKLLRFTTPDLRIIDDLGTAALARRATRPLRDHPPPLRDGLDGPLLEQRARIMVRALP